MKININKIAIIGIISIFMFSNLIIPISANTIEENKGIKPLGEVFDLKITGPSVVNISETVKFTFTCDGWNCDEVRFHIDWKIYDGQDFSVDETTDFYPLNKLVDVYHTFDVGGIYKIAVRGEDETGSFCGPVYHYIEVKGGQVDLFIAEVGTWPDRFTPSQEVEPYFIIGNKGNRDAYCLNSWFYLDGECIHVRQGLILLIRNPIIEAGGTATSSYAFNWPEDYEDHEIKYEIEGIVDYVYKSAKENLPPEKPEKPDAPLFCVVNREVYTIVNIPNDPCEQDIYILADWGDGTNSGWIGPYEADDCQDYIEHTYGKIGNYKIKIKAKDIHNAESEWSESDTIKIIRTRQRNKALNTPYLNLLQNYPTIYQLFQRLLKI